MTSASPFAGADDALESLYAELCSLKKVQSSGNGGKWTKPTNALKNYVTGRVGIIVTYNPDMARKYHFLFLRVPPLEKAKRSSIVDVDFTNRYARNLCGCANPDGMLVVSHLGDFSRKIISSGVAFSSSVWLLPPDFVDDCLSDCGFRLALPFIDNATNTHGAICPREILIKPAVPQRAGSCMEGHVEGMLQVNDCIPQIAFNRDGNILDKNDLSHVLASLRVHIFLKSECVILNVSGDLDPSRFYARLCPINLLTDFIKLRHSMGPPE